MERKLTFGMLKHACDVIELRKGLAYLHKHAATLSNNSTLPRKTLSSANLRRASTPTVTPNRTVATRVSQPSTVRSTAVKSPQKAMGFSAPKPLTPPAPVKPMTPAKPAGKTVARAPAVTYDAFRQKAEKSGWKFNNGTWTSPKGQTYSEMDVMRKIEQRNLSGQNGVRGFNQTAPQRQQAAGIAPKPKSYNFGGPSEERAAYISNIDGTPGTIVQVGQKTYTSRGGRLTPTKPSTSRGEITVYPGYDLDRYGNLVTSDDGIARAYEQYKKDRNGYMSGDRRIGNLSLLAEADKYIQARKRRERREPLEDVSSPISYFD